LRFDTKEAFAEYLRSYIKKGSNKQLSEQTIESVLIYTKHIDETKKGQSIEQIQRKYATYQKKHNHSMAKYALWHYLKYLGYDEKFLKELINFQTSSSSALSDSEKLIKSVLSKKELKFLVESIEKVRDKLIIKLLYDTGARVSELTNITLKDIDLQSKEIYLMGKGNKPRSVFFQNSTKTLLRKHLAENNIENPNSKIFKIKPITVWYHLKRYGKDILNRDLRPHMLRHTRLQHMADDGVDSFLIKSYAGHSDIGTTQIYVKSSKYQGKMAFQRAGDIWEEDKKKKHGNLSKFL